MHSRTPSNSFRIAINTSSSTSSSPSKSPSRKRAPSSWLSSFLPSSSSSPPTRSPTSTSRSRSPPPFSPHHPQRSSSALSSIFRHRWPTLLFFSFVFLLAYSSLSPGSWLNGLISGRNGTTDAVPVVDRNALEKLRLLEIHYGSDEDDPDLDRASPGALEGSASRQRKLAKGGGNAGAVMREERPPMVVNMPEIIKPNPLLPAPLPRVSASELDDLVCPSSAEGNSPTGGCAFLVPAWLGEQETKAQLHLYQLGLLALALNRTLVLPNVAKSRLSTCFNQPFSFYYAEDSLEALGISTIGQAEFLDWSERRDPPGTAQVVSMVSGKATYALGAIEIDSASDPTLVPNKPSRKLCLSSPKTRLDFSGHSPLAIYPPTGYHKTEAGRTGFGESVVNTLKSEEVGTKSSRAGIGGVEREPYHLPNVLAFNYELRFPIMSPAVVTHFVPSLLDDPPLPFSHFPYADTWSDIGTTIAENLSPFIAIHWRTETLLSSNLVPCSTALINKLIRLKSQYPSITNVYFATDYPLESLDPNAPPGEAAAHSGTFSKVVTEQHHTAFRNFLRDFNKKALGLRLTTFSKEQPSLTLPPSLTEVLYNLTAASTSSSEDLSSPPPSPPPSFSLADLDPGLIGIIDKTVAMRAEVFLTGFAGVGPQAKDGCAKVSSFTNQIIGAREDLMAVEREVEMDEEENEDGTRGRAEEMIPGKLWNKVSRWGLGKAVEEDD